MDLFFKAISIEPYVIPADILEHSQQVFGPGCGTQMSLASVINVLMVRDQHLIFVHSAGSDAKDLNYCFHYSSLGLEVGVEDALLFTPLLKVINSGEENSSW